LLMIQGATANIAATTINPIRVKVVITPTGR
jgi:hypothetical protein